MIFFRSRCYNGGKQHNFQPRVITSRTGAKGPSCDSRAMTIDSGSGPSVTQTYCGDVCSWCGAVVNLPEKTP